MLTPLPPRSVRQTAVVARTLALRALPLLALCLSAPLRAAGPVSPTEIDFWVRAGRSSAEIIQEVRQRGLLEAIDADAQHKLQADGAGADLMRQLGDGRRFVVSEASAARAREEQTRQEERQRVNREFALRQVRASQDLRRDPSAPPGAPPPGAPPPGAPAPTARNPVTDVPPVSLTVDEENSRDGWHAGFARARELAFRQNKPLLAVFSSLDSDPLSQRLQREVLGTPDFASYAAENLVLVRLEFPRRWALPEELTEQNQKLFKVFDLKSLPGVVVLAPDGRLLGKLGYQSGGTPAFLAALRDVVRTAQPTASR